MRWEAGEGTLRSQWPLSDNSIGTSTLFTEAIKIQRRNIVFKQKVSQMSNACHAYKLEKPLLTTSLI